MPPSVTNFSQSAEKLSRNPLGIIALFIVLVYAIAALTLFSSFKLLQPIERIVIIGFITGFPLIVLFVFYKLVTGHHAKLYAPRDFHDPDGFFRAQTPEERQSRREQDLREVQQEIQEGSGSTLVQFSDLPNKQAPVSDDDQAPSPDKPHREVKQPNGDITDGRGFPYEITPQKRHLDLQSIFMAEELAIRELESEFEKVILRDVAVNDRGVDGAFMANGKVVAIEVKYIRDVSRLRNVVNQTHQRMASYFGDLGLSPRVIVAIVAGEHSSDELRREYDRLARRGILALSDPNNIRLYSLPELRAKYGVQLLVP